MKLKDHYRAYRYRFLLDTDEIRFLRKVVPKDSLAIDIGAHKGGYTYWIKRCVGKNGQVVAFEPQPALFEQLKKTYSNSEVVQCHQMALSSKAGELELFVPGKKSSSPGATLEERNEEGLKVKTQVTTLDDFFGQEKRALSLIKIDVEGHEWKVLLGGEELIMIKRPALIIEAEERHVDYPLGRFFNYIEERLGYKGHFIYKSRKTPVSDFKKDVHQKQEGERFWALKDYVNNFLFIPHQ